MKTLIESAEKYLVEEDEVGHAIGHCKDCSSWEDGECFKAETVYVSQREPLNKSDDTFEMSVDVLDDSGLSVELHTGSNFGCVKFNQR